MPWTPLSFWVSALAFHYLILILLLSSSRMVSIHTGSKGALMSSQHSMCHSLCSLLCTSMWDMPHSNWFLLLLPQEVSCTTLAWGKLASPGSYMLLHMFNSAYRVLEIIHCLVKVDDGCHVLVGRTFHGLHDMRLLVYDVLIAMHDCFDDSRKCMG